MKDDSKNNSTEVKNICTELIDCSGRLSFRGKIRNGAFSIDYGPDNNRILLTISTGLMKQTKGRDAILAQFRKVYRGSDPVWTFLDTDGSYMIEITIINHRTANAKLHQLLDLIEKEAEVTNENSESVRPIVVVSRWETFLNLFRNKKKP